MLFPVFPAVPNAVPGTALFPVLFLLFPFPYRREQQEREQHGQEQEIR
jgi:hypothetical protein